MGNNIILETKFVADIRGSFYIPSYQRGYRWSETEVVRLLDDIYQNGKKNYCLQPVVVRKKEDRYELIDGQQRLIAGYTDGGAPYGVMWEEVGIDPGLPFEEKVKLYHMQMLGL